MFPSDGPQHQNAVNCRLAANGTWSLSHADHRPTCMTGQCVQHPVVVYCGTQLRPRDLAIAHARQHATVWTPFATLSQLVLGLQALIA